MAFKCYRKLAPANPVRLPNNASLKFKSVDNVLGYYATQDPAIQGVLDGYIRAGEYGLTEVSEKEFHEFLIKKNLGYAPPSREEFSPTALSKLIVASAQYAEAAKSAGVGKDISNPVVTVVNPTQAPIVATQPAPVAPQAPVKPEFTPTVGKRRAGRRRNSLLPE